MKIGLFFGSFNPIHIGHTIIARYAAENFKLKQVWFVVSPHNPFKSPEKLKHNNKNLKNLSALSDKFQIIKLVCREMSDKKCEFVACDTEYIISQPSYTANTLKYLFSQKENKRHEFHIIMGTDCLRQLPQWKDYDYIVENFPIVVYPRLHSPFSIPKEIQKKKYNYNISMLSDSSIIELSSTEIRARVNKGKPIQYMVPKIVENQIELRGLYK